MKLPQIGDSVTTHRAIELCRHFRLDYLIERVESTPDKYKDWTFDGCSGLPDEIMGFFTGCNWQDITYQCCLPHDLRYAYGKPGDKAERKSADEQFHNDLIERAGMKRWQAAAFFTAVRAGGPESFGFSFSWGFAHR